MSEALEFLIRHGYSVLFAVIFIEQIGLPIPAAPLMLAAGALAGAKQLSFALAVGVGSLATLLADTIWYELGRRRGSRVLQLLCRIALEPDSCVRRTEDVFVRHGARSLIVAKFIPGLSTVTPPLAGIFRMRLPRFLFFDGLGALIWVGAYTGLGFVFSDQIERVAARAAELGARLVLILVVALT
ncbi:MAG: DedA family protein, partial [Candidatus Methylomirabilales bacterium]